MDTANANHKQHLARWEAMDGDVRIEVNLVQDDEYTPWDGQWLAHPAQARLHLRCLCSNHNVVCTVEHDVPIQAEAFLNAPEVRRLAADLIEVADRIDLAGVTR